MNDSLLDELEGNEDTPYQPLLSEETQTVFSPRRPGEDDVWAELGGTHDIGGSGTLPAPNSFKDRIIQSIADKGRTLRDASQNATNYTSLRKGDLPSPGFNLESGGNVPDDDGNVRNIDSFLTSLYNYYYHKGYQSILVSGLVSLVNLLFTIFLSTFLLGCVDWSGLSSCNSDYEQGKTDIRGCNQPLSQYISCTENVGMFKTMIFFYFCLFLGIWIWNFFGFISTIRDTREMHKFYRDRLKLSTRQIQTMSWDAIVNRVISLNKGHLGPYQTKLSETVLTPHNIASRIMRRENYMIAFLNMNVFNLDVGLPAHASRVFFARNMEWNIHFCVLNHMFDANFGLKRTFITDVEGLQKRFVVVGVINFFMVPFILLFMVIHFFLKYTQEWHTRRNYLGPRQWSPLALWRFREFNELPHVFDKRIATSYPVAQEYQNVFPPTILSIVARGITFISGSLIAVLFIFSLVEEAIILEVHVFNRQLLWYLTILTGIFALARSFVPSSNENTEDPEELMMKLSAHTHYFPLEWKGRCGTFDVRDQVFELFQYKIQLFFHELVSVIITPYLLCFSFPKGCSKIIDFVHNHTVMSDPSLGAVCRYSLFDFKQYGNEQYGCEKGLKTDQASMNGKMEKSFVNFKQNHPTWIANEEGEAMLGRLDAFKTEQESIQLEKSIASLAGNRTDDGSPSISTMDLGSLLFGHSTTEQPLSASQQLLQSQAIQAALGQTQHGNNFYWMEKYAASREL